jgi:Protein of unknown function (DUF3089)
MIFTKKRVAWVTTALILLAGGYLWLLGSEHPPLPFDKTTPPPAPDYARSQAWLAFPGRNGFERSAPPGDTPIPEADAVADVFFIHPTTYLKNDVWNVPIDAHTRYGVPVLLNQASVFNGCCRIYAPHYRQAALKALNASRPAVDLAFGDVERAFLWYMQNENHGRPFILASHSQGSGHAVRLLQQDILGTPLQQRLIAAYVIGAYVPSDIESLGLIICDRAEETGCIVSWNTTEVGRRGAERLMHDTNYWWRGAWKATDLPPAVCVNPLSWRREGAAPASANLGSETLTESFDDQTPPRPIVLQPAARELTGAECDRGLLDVDVAPFKRGYASFLRIVYGSFHVLDYGLFYENLRRNAAQRTAAWQAMARQ